MASSPTPSLDSIRCTNSIESFGDHNGYLSDSPLTLSRSSPPECDSALCEDFTTNSNATVNQHHSISTSVSSSSSSSSGLSGCGSSSSSNNSDVINTPGVIGSSLMPSNGKCSPSKNTLTNNSVIKLTTESGKSTPRCTACKSTQLNAVAKCFDCVSYLCSNCVTAHEFMHCFNGHNVCIIKNMYQIAKTETTCINSNTGQTSTNELKFSSSLASLVQQQSIQHQKQKPLSHLSKIVMNSAAANGSGMDSNSTVSIPVNCIDYTDGVEHRDDIFESTGSNMLLPRNPLFCNRHKSELLKYNCRSCCSLACTECILADHSTGIHELENIQEHSVNSNYVMTLKTGSGFQSFTDQSSLVQSVISELRGKLGDIVNIITNSDACLSKIKMQYQKAHNEINETYQFFCSMLDERKQEMLKELETLYNKKVTSNTNWLQRSKDLMEKTIQTCEALERSPKSTNVSDLLMLRKTLEVQLQAVVQDLQAPFELEFLSNYQSIQNGVRNNFGCIRTVKNDIFSSGQKQPPIARPVQQSSSSSGSSNSSVSGVGNSLTGNLGLSTTLMDSSYCNGGNNSNLLVALRNSGTNTFDDIIGKPYQLSFNSSSPQIISSSTGTFPNNPYEKWSNGCTENLFSISTDPFAAPQIFNTLNSSVVNGSTSINTLNMISGSNSSDSLLDLTTKLLSASIYPPKSQIKRQKMIYHCKFGEFGVMEGQFTEPSGVTVNAQNDIIVADTNNHRIQIFDKEGRFKFQFGECGKRDSQLLYPNRVAVVRSSGDIIVTERSPTHQIQIYNQYGQFVRKFGANILQHPRGVTVDNKGRIIVVECKVMRVIIFDQNGNVLHKFGCSKHLEFPNGVVVNDKQEIFISDNRAHCVKVFNYEGQYLRQIGGEGVTNYPIGVGINVNGEILIADNHNNFNLTIFTQDGQLVSALESKVKHAQCFDVALMDDGSVVLASKDYRLYIYRYIQVPPIGL